MWGWLHSGRARELPREQVPGDTSSHAVLRRAVTPDGRRGWGRSRPRCWGGSRAGPTPPSAFMHAMDKASDAGARCVVGWPTGVVACIGVGQHPVGVVDTLNEGVTPPRPVVT